MYEVLSDKKIGDLIITYATKTKVTDSINMTYLCDKLMISIDTYRLSILSPLSHINVIFISRQKTENESDIFEKIKGSNSISPAYVKNWDCLIGRHNIYVDLLASMSETFNDQKLENLNDVNSESNLNKLVKRITGSIIHEAIHLIQIKHYRIKFRASNFANHVIKSAPSDVIEGRELARKMLSDNITIGYVGYTNFLRNMCYMQNGFLLNLRMYLAEGFAISLQKLYSEKSSLQILAEHNEKQEFLFDHVRKRFKVLDSILGRDEKVMVAICQSLFYLRLKSRGRQNDFFLVFKKHDFTEEELLRKVKVFGKILSDCSYGKKIFDYSGGIGNIFDPHEVGYLMVEVLLINGISFQKIIEMDEFEFIKSYESACADLAIKPLLGFSDESAIPINTFMNFINRNQNLFYKSYIRWEKFFEENGVII